MKEKGKFIEKILFVFLSMFVFMALPAHADTTSGLLDLGVKIVPADKQWTIKFNKPIKFDTSGNQCITVTDSSGEAVKVGEYLSTDGTSVIVTPPDGGYTYGQTYELDVKDGIISEGNEILKQPAKLVFSIGSDSSGSSSITGVDDSIKLVVGRTYTLTPKMADSSGSEVNNSKFSYSSNNSSVASVSEEGVITAVSEGSTIINISAGTVTKQVIVNVDNELSVKDIAKNSDAVVYIEVSDANKQPIASGSGFIVTTDGTVVTNYHVIDGASYAKVTLENGTQYDVDKVLAASKEHDLAVLKLKNASNLPVVKLGDSDKLSPGDEIVAIGSPGGIKFQNTVTDGIVSGFRTSGRSAEGVQDIQISASIYHGSSGGALFNSYGEAIGVTYAGSTEVPDVNFAIPINELKPLLSENMNVTLLSLADTPPSAPTGLKAVQNYDDIEVSWNQSSDSDVAGYYLYESSNPNTGFTRLSDSDIWFGTEDLIQSNEVDVSGGTEGETVYFYVTAVNKNGLESPKSQVISVTCR